MSTLDIEALKALHPVADRDEQVILDGGTHLAVRRWGVGQPVLCLHAAGHSSEDYAALAARIGDRYEVIAFDWPGHGQSEADSGRALASRYADLALAACEQLNIDRPIVIGNSIGGAAALIAAVKAPDRFKALVLCNPGGLAKLDLPARVVIGRMAAFFRAGARGAWWFHALFAAYYRWMVLPLPAAKMRRDAIVASGRQSAALLADAWQGFAEEGGDLRSLTPQLQLPVWLAWAKGDRFVAWDRAKKAAFQIPDHQVTLFRGGHSPFMEEPDAFAAGFIDFATRQSRRSIP